MATASIRPASLADIPALAEDRAALFVESAPITAEQAERLREDTVAVLTPDLASGRALAWIAESAAGDRLGSAAACIVRRLPTPWNPTGMELFLAQMYIRPGHRGAGVGTALLEAVTGAARVARIATVRLRSTDAGLALYRRHGFSLLPSFMERRLDLERPDDR